MAPVTAFIQKVKDNPILAVRYVLIAVGLVTVYGNLMDCINQGAEPRHYLLYVGLTGGLTILIILIQSNAIVCFVLALLGILTIVDSPVHGISYGIFWLILSKRIASNLVFSLFIYFVTLLAVTAHLTIIGKSPADGILVLIATYAIYLIDAIIPGGNL